MKHAKEIHAWADGAVIQFRTSNHYISMRPTSEYDWQVCPNNHPGWSDYNVYRASLAIVEGKPVFEGDEIYGCGGIKFIVPPKWNPSKDVANKCSWNPPAPSIPEGFTPWSGGECPVNLFANVEVLFNNGRGLGCAAGIVGWKNVIAYRVVRKTININGKEYPAPDGGHFRLVSALALSHLNAFGWESDKDRDAVEAAIAYLLEGK